MKKLSLFTVSLIIASISAHAQNQIPPIKDLPVVKKAVVNKEAPANYNRANKAIKNNIRQKDIKPAIANKINNNQAQLPQIAKQVEKRKVQKQPANPNNLAIDNAVNSRDQINPSAALNQNGQNNNYGSRNSDLKKRVKKRLQMMRNLTPEQREAVKQARKEYLEKVKKITNNQIAN